MSRIIILVVAAIALILAYMAGHGQKTLLEIVNECEREHPGYACGTQMAAACPMFDKLSLDELIALMDDIVAAGEEGKTWNTPGAWKRLELPPITACPDWNDSPQNYAALLLGCSEWDGRTETIRKLFNMPHRARLPDDVEDVGHDDDASAAA